MREYSKDSEAAVSKSDILGKGEKGVGERGL